MLSVLWFILLLMHGNAIILRIRQVNGVVVRHSASSSDLVSNIVSKLPDMNCNTTLVFPNGEKHTFESLCQSKKTISEYGVQNGDLLDVMAPFNATRIHQETIEKITNKSAHKVISPLKATNIARLKNNAPKIRLAHLKPVSRLVRLHHTTKSLFKDSCHSDSLLLLLGYSRVEQVNYSSKNVRTLKDGPKELQVDDVLAVVEIAVNHTSNRMPPLIKRKLESVIDLANALNLTVLGCAYGNVKTSDDWKARHIHTALQVKSVLQQKLYYNHNITNNLLLASVRNSSSSAKALSGRRNRSILAVNSSDVIVEAFQLNDWALQLARDGMLTTDPIKGSSLSDGDSSNSSSNQVHLNGTVVVQQRDVSTIDASLLLVPLAVSLRKCTSRFFSNARYEPKHPLFHHQFPSIDRLVDAKSLRESVGYVLRLLRIVLKYLKERSSVSSFSSSDAKLVSEVMEALSRLRDPHLLWYLQTRLGVKNGNALCQMLLNVDLTQPVEPNVLVQLQTLLKTVEFSLKESNDD